MTAANIRLETATLWVQIWGAPLDMFTSQVAKEVGSRLGAVEEVEQRRGQDELHYFMRVRVALPISKPIRRGSFIAGSDGEKHWVNFKYERLPLFCHFCGLLGHDVRNCAEHFAATATGGSIAYQYGDFLKAMGGRARGGSFERKTGGAEYGTEEGGESASAGSYRPEGGPVRSELPLQLGSVLAAADGQCKNPRKDDEGQSDSVGITAHIQENYQAHATDVVKLSADVHSAESALKANRVQLCDGSPSGLDGKAEDSTVMGLKGARVCFVNPPIGPNGVKPKSTWTRFNRMDFGLGGLQKVFLPSNGKRPIPVEIDRN